MIESIKIQFEILLRDLKAFVNDFLGDENPLLPRCPYAKDEDHAFKCAESCIIKLRESDLNAVLDKIKGENQTVAYVDCLHNMSPLLSLKCHLLLCPCDAEEAAGMCLSIMRLQAVSVIVLDSWSKLPLKEEIDAFLSENIALKRYRFFQDKMASLVRHAQKSQIRVFLLD